jgi:hypothetical protein
MITSGIPDSGAILLLGGIGLASLVLALRLPLRRWLRLGGRKRPFE